MPAYAAEKRMGTPEELGFAIATVANERNGYLAGVDVLVDGGNTNGRNFDFFRFFMLFCTSNIKWIILWLII